MALIAACIAAACTSTSLAAAEEPPQQTAPAPSAATGGAAQPSGAAAPNAPLVPPLETAEDIAPATSSERHASVEPKPAELAAPGRSTFDVDPVGDIALVSGSVAFAGLLDLINGTGEVRPQQIAPNFDKSSLLGIDRGAVSQTIDDNARTYSNVGLGVAAAYAALDPIFSGLREKNVQTGLIDAILYAETASLTWAVTNLAKMAVRRPRPIAYVEFEANRGNPNYSNSNTDSALSFFSGHSSMVAGLGATATYLAFVRSPHTARPWITLVLATALATFVSVERVRSGAHFPTDVIAGSIAGAGIGVIVPHLHRSDEIKQRRVWVGFMAPERIQGMPMPEGGGLNVSGVF